MIYRVQDGKGRGPFRPGFSAKWTDQDFAPGMAPLPTWMEEFGFDLIDREGRQDEHFGSAVRSVAAIGLWFSDSEQEKLHRLGFRVTGHMDFRVLAESENQLVFASPRPLHRMVRIAQWPFKEKGPVARCVPALD